MVSPIRGITVADYGFDTFETLREHSFSTGRAKPETAAKSGDNIRHQRIPI